MQFVLRYNVQFGKAEAFREWLQENRIALDAHGPEGWHYLGTWFTVRFLGRFNCESRWELDSYASLGSGFGSDVGSRLNGEMFRDYVDASSPQEAILMKGVDEVTITDGM